LQGGGRIFGQQTESDRKLKTTAQSGGSQLVLFTKYNRVMESREMRWEVHVTRTGEQRNTYEILVGEPEGKMPLGRPRHK
jgi:hypothetical protein